LWNKSSGPLLQGFSYPAKLDVKSSTRVLIIWDRFTPSILDTIHETWDVNPMSLKTKFGLVMWGAETDQKQGQWSKDVGRSGCKTGLMYKSPQSTKQRALSILVRVGML
jgi:hypothetical protein